MLQRSTKGLMTSSFHMWALSLNSETLSESLSDRKYFHCFSKTNKRRRKELSSSLLELSRTASGARLLMAPKPRRQHTSRAVIADLYLMELLPCIFASFVSLWIFDEGRARAALTIQRIHFAFIIQIRALLLNWKIFSVVKYTKAIFPFSFNCLGWKKGALFPPNKSWYSGELSAWTLLWMTKQWNIPDVCGRGSRMFH